MFSLPGDAVGDAARGQAPGFKRAEHPADADGRPGHVRQGGSRILDALADGAPVRFIGDVAAFEEAFVLLDLVAGLLLGRPK